MDIAAAQIWEVSEESRLRSHDRSLQPRADHLVPLCIWDNGVDEQPSAVVYR
jgi:hypothetical protein